MPCDCMDKADAVLAGYNAKLVRTFPLLGPRLEAPTLALEKVGKGKRPPVLKASFCPFCGVKYPTMVAAEPSAASDIGATP